MKVYTGDIGKGRNFAGGFDIFISQGKENYRLSPKASQKIHNHSPDGFCWGFGGSGPAQAALGILLDCVGEDLAKRYYGQFKRDCVAGWDKKFQISETEIKDWIQKQEEEYEKT